MFVVIVKDRLLRLVFINLHGSDFTLGLRGGRQAQAYKKQQQIYADELTHCEIDLFRRVYAKVDINVRDVRIGDEVIDHLH